MKKLLNTKQRTWEAGGTIYPFFYAVAPELMPYVHNLTLENIKDSGLLEDTGKPFEDMAEAVIKMIETKWRFIPTTDFDIKEVRKDIKKYICVYTAFRLLEELDKDFEIVKELLK